MRDLHIFSTVRLVDRLHRAWLIGILLLAGAIHPSLHAQDHLTFPRGEFPKTDFSNASVELGEIMSGGPPRDGIPAIDDPVFIDIAQASAWISDSEPVIVVERDDDVRAYPIQILMFHEIVNDMIAGLPVAVTFCPLCNASIVFERRVDNAVLDFGTTGRLRNSDLIMYDRQSETWWQQFTGRGIIGRYNGVRLERLPSQIVAFGELKASFPGASVLSRDTGFSRPYGENPYRGYDAIDNNPFLFKGDTDPRLPAMERVLAIASTTEAFPDSGRQGNETQSDTGQDDTGQDDTGQDDSGQNNDAERGSAAQRDSGQAGTLLIPLSVIVGPQVLNLTVGQSPIVVFGATETNSALDRASIAESRMIPAAAAFLATIDGAPLSFVPVNGQVRD